MLVVFQAVERTWDGQKITCMVHSKGFRPTWIFGVAALVACGCAPTSPLRGVQGTVTLEREPVASGTIEFTPVNGTKGAPAGAAVENGSYLVPQAHGVRVGGTYKVSIVAMKKTGRKVEGFGGKDGKPLDEFAKYIPDEYNSASKLTVRVTDDPVNHIDFPLKKDGSWNSGAGGSGGTP